MENLSIAFTGYLPDGQKQLVKELDLTGIVEEKGFLSKEDFLQIY